MKNCDRCQRNSGENKRYNLLHPVKVTAKVWYLVGIDLINACRTSAKGYTDGLLQQVRWNYSSPWQEYLECSKRLVQDVLSTRSSSSHNFWLGKRFWESGKLHRLWNHIALIVHQHFQSFLKWLSLLQVCEQLMKSFEVQHRITVKWSGWEIKPVNQKVRTFYS